MSTFVIAEMAGTHDGSFERARYLVALAYEAGANAIKSQFWSDSAKEAARVNAPELAPLFERVRMPRAWLAPLKALAHARGMEFLCTVELPEDIATVAPYVDRFKIASTSAEDWAFIRAHLPYGKRLIVSTGMLSKRLSEWYADWADQIPEPWPLLSVLHCVSGYPTPVDEANLGAIRGEGDTQGFSDHTAHVLTGAFAVCAGARILEVHVRADDTPMDNPDYAHSLTPAQFREYVQNVRLAERMLGDGVKRIMPCELPTLRYRVTV